MTTYFVAAAAHGGSDANNGTTSGTPWLTTTHVNTTVYAPGDSVLFNGGDTIAGAINLTTANWPGPTLDPTATGLTKAALSNGNLTYTCTSSPGGTSHSWASGPISSGLYYAEFYFIGTSYTSATDSAGVGIGAGALTSTTGPGGPAGSSLGYYPDGVIYVGGVSSGTTIAAWNATAGLLMRVAVNLTTGKIWFSPGLTANWNNASSGTQNPVGSVGGFTIPGAALVGGFKFGVEVANATTPDTVTARLASWSWEGTPPAGYGSVLSTQPSSGTQVTFDSYGTGVATISSGTSAGFHATGIPGLAVQNLIFTGSSATNGVNGVFIENNNAGNSKIPGITLSNLTVSLYGLSGILLRGTGPAALAASASPPTPFTPGFSSALVAGCTAHHCTGNTSTTTTAGIKFGSIGYGLGVSSPSHTNPTVINCVAHDNTGGGNSGNWSGSGIFIGQASGATIQYCEAYANAANNTANNAPPGIWIGDCGSSVIQFCESYSNTGAGGGGGFDIDGGCVNCTNQYCYSHDNTAGAGYGIYGYSDTAEGGGAFPGNSGCTVRYCISQNDQSGVLIGADGVSNTGANVYNNTIYCNGTGGCVALEGSSLSGITGTVANNILYAASGTKLMWFTAATGTPSGLAFQGNNYRAAGTFSMDWGVSNYSSFAAWKTATSKESLSSSWVTSDPMLVSPGGGGTTHGYVPALLGAYALQGGSPMVGVALNMNTNFTINPGTQDFYGVPIPNSAAGTGYNVGAWDAAVAMGGTTAFITSTSVWSPGSVGLAAGSVITIAGISAGGGGGGAAAGGGGGGAYAAAPYTLQTADISNGIQITIGAAGTAGAPSAITVGGSGGALMVKGNNGSGATILSLTGGQGGPIDGVTRANGGTVVTGVGFSGGAGGTGGTLSNAGPGGGGAAGPNGAGAAGGNSGGPGSYNAYAGGGGGGANGGSAGGDGFGNVGTFNGGAGGNNRLGAGGGAGGVVTGGSGGLVNGAAGSGGGGGGGGSIIVPDNGGGTNGSGGAGSADLTVWDGAHGPGSGTGGGGAISDGNNTVGGPAGAQGANGYGGGGAGGSSGDSGGNGAAAPGGSGLVVITYSVAGPGSGAAAFFFGGSLQPLSLLGAATAWKAVKALERNANLGRRKFLSVLGW